MKRNNTDTKIIAFDLDGTLLRSDKSLSKETKNALAAAAEAGVVLVPATGRFYAMIPKEVRELPFLRYFLTVNGAQLIDIKEQRVIYGAGLSAEKTLEVLDYLPGVEEDGTGSASSVFSKDGITCLLGVYQDGEGWMSSAHYALIDEYMLNPAANLLIRQTYQVLPDLRQVVEERGREIQKVSAYLKNEEVRNRVLGKISGAISGISVSAAMPNNIEVTNVLADKGRALRALCEELGIDPASSMAFGDGLNDVQLLDAAGVAVVMDNASDDVKAHADLIAPDNDSDGVAKVIREVIRPL